MGPVGGMIWASWLVHCQMRRDVPEEEEVRSEQGHTGAELTYASWHIQQVRAG